MFGKRYIQKIVGIAALTALTTGTWSCSDESVTVPEGEKGDQTFTITLSVGGHATKATQAGEDLYNENKLSNYTLIFYSATDKDCSAPKYIIQGADLNATGSATVSVKLDVAEVEKLFPDNSTTCQVYAITNLPSEYEDDKDKKEDWLRYDIFKPSEQGYQIAYPGELRNVPATKTYLDKAIINYNFGNHRQARADGFVMKGESANITLDRNTHSLSGNVNLTRLSAKFRLWIKLPEKVYVQQSGNVLSNADLKEMGVLDENGNFKEDNQIEDINNKFLDAGGKICKPIYPKNEEGSLNPDDNTDQENNHEVSLSIFHGVKKSRLDGKVLMDENESDFSTRWLQEEDYFSSAVPKVFIPNAYNPDNKEDENGKGFSYCNKLPVYSYPNTWSNAADEEKQSSLSLTIWWDERTKDGNSVEASYYSLPINKFGNPANCLKANTYYRVRLTVGMLGSYSKGEPTEIEEASWEALDWADEDIEMSLNQNRYLVFNKKEYVMNNTEEISIPFTSSHNTTVKSVTLTYYDYYNYKTDGTVISYDLTLIDNQSVDGKIFSIDSDLLAKGILKFTHPLKVWEKSTNGEVVFKEGDNPFSKFDITITLVHSDLKDQDDTMFQETVSIIQYPAIYIENEYVGQNSTSPIKNDGFILINDYFGDYVAASTTDNNDPNNKPNWMSCYVVGGLNPNMYIITITQLSSNESEFQIGDPRILHINNDLGNPEKEKNANDNNRDGASLKDTEDYLSPWVRSTYNTRLNDEGKYVNYTSQGKAPVEAQRLYFNGNGTISSYYPTDESKEIGSKANMIAPKLRVASGNSASRATNRVRARRRCASYQEAGYPAGRWRLPTKSEMSFIANLSANGKIPNLFRYVNNSSDYGYWTAQGAFGIAENDITIEGIKYKQGDLIPVWDEEKCEINSDHYIRCVYDEWYWVKNDGSPDRLPKDQWSIFTWGDKAKDNVQ